jgi:hypothetical protein
VTGNTANRSFNVSAAPSTRLPIPLKAPAGMPPGWGFLLRRAAVPRLSYQSSENFHLIRSFAFDGASFSKYGRAESHSAEQRIPRSHSSASLRSRSASARLLLAMASLRYRTARRLLMSKIQRNKTGIQIQGLVPDRRLTWHRDKIDEGPRAALKGRRALIGPALSFSRNPCYPRADECGAEAARAS